MVKGKPCCDTQDRTIESVKACGCRDCEKWWAQNVPGYFYCPGCETACTPPSDQYDGLCEQCFDEQDEQELYGADPNCEHQVEPQWSGVKCVKCGGWFCH